MITQFRCLRRRRSYLCRGDLNRMYLLVTCAPRRLRGEEEGASFRVEEQSVFKISCRALGWMSRSPNFWTETLKELDFSCFFVRDSLLEPSAPHRWSGSGSDFITPELFNTYREHANRLISHELPRKARFDRCLLDLADHHLNQLNPSAHFPSEVSTLSPLVFTHLHSQLISFSQ